MIVLSGSKGYIDEDYEAFEYFFCIAFGYSWSKLWNLFS